MLRDHEDKICYEGEKFNVKSAYSSMDSNRVLFSLMVFRILGLQNWVLPHIGRNSGKNYVNVLAQEKRLVSRQLMLPLSLRNQPVTC